MCLRCLSSWTHHQRSHLSFAEFLESMVGYKENCLLLPFCIAMFVSFPFFRLQGESQQNNNIIDYSPTKRTPFKTVIGRNAVCNEGLNELLMDNNPDHER